MKTEMKTEAEVLAELQSFARGLAQYLAQQHDLLHPSLAEYDEAIASAQKAYEDGLAALKEANNFKETK